MPYTESEILDILTPTVYLPEVEITGKMPRFNENGVEISPEVFARSYKNRYYISRPTPFNINRPKSERVFKYSPKYGYYPVKSNQIDPEIRTIINTMGKNENSSYGSINSKDYVIMDSGETIGLMLKDNQIYKENKKRKPQNMFRIFQQGGQMDQQQQALVQFIQGIAQVAQVDPQQVMQLAQQEPDRLETAVQVFQQTQDIQQAAQAFFQKEVQSAKKGAKLNYLKELSGKCPEGQLLVYFKSGGHICSKCMAKKQEGDEIEEAKCGSKMKKKKGCGGFKINKSQGGSNSNEFLTDYSKPNIKTTMKLPSGKIIKKKLTEGLKEGEDRITINGTNYYLGGDSILVKSTNPNEVKSFKLLRKEKKKFGGSLNGIPFKQPGGIVKRINNTLYGLKKLADITNHPQSAQGTVTTKNGIDRTIWKNEFGLPTDTTYTHPIYPEWYAKKIYEEGEDNLINRGIRKVKKIIANPKFSLGDGGSLNKIPFKLPGGTFGLLKNRVPLLLDRVTETAEDYMRKLWIENNKKNGIYDKERVLPDGTKIKYNTFPGAVTPDNENFNGYDGYWTIYNPDGTKKRIHAETNRGGGFDVGLFNENNDMVFHGPVRAGGLYFEDERLKAIRNRQKINNSLKKYGINFR